MYVVLLKYIKAHFSSKDKDSQLCLLLTSQMQMSASQIHTGLLKNLLYAPSNQISLNSWLEIQRVSLSSLQWLTPHLHSSTNTGATECNRWKPSSTCTVIFACLKAGVSEGKGMRWADCRDAPQDYNTGRAPGLTGPRSVSQICLTDESTGSCKVFKVGKSEELLVLFSHLKFCLNPQFFLSIKTWDSAEGHHNLLGLT